MKKKCNYLKAVRKNIADQLGIDLHQKECTFEGKCKGTCPKCEQEEKILNMALLKKGAVIVGVSAIALSTAACTDISGQTEPQNSPPVIDQPTDLEGEVAEPDGPVVEEPAPTDLEGDVAIEDL